ncbi:Zinc finger, SWIM-type [Phytophthora cactorum]|nr:Zinc finger, SWIM-type [Phytophthora cactorum]
MITKEYPYCDGVDAGEAFFFGPEDDDDGFPRIGKGSDGDPFVLGRMTLEMLSKINQLRGEEHFCPCHTVATFKSTDLGYPVLTCGITDRARTYLAAILVVSARIHREYELEFGSVAKMCALLHSMITLTEDVGCDVPAPTASIASPDADIKTAAKWMLTTKAVAGIRTNVDTQVRVLHILEIHVDATAMEATRCLASSVIVGDGKTPSLSRLRENMPTSGWLVNIEESKCNCSMHLKFGICSHVVVAKSVLGIDGSMSFGDKLMSRRARKKQNRQTSGEMVNTEIAVLEIATDVARFDVDHTQIAMMGDGQ